MTETEQQPDVEVKPLQDWSNAPTVADLKKDLEAAKQSHDTAVGQINEWLDNYHIRNKAKPKVAKGNSEVQPRLIRKQAEWRFAPLSEPFLSTDELFNVRPVTWEDRKAAQQNELLLNHQFNTQIDRVNLFDTAVRAAVAEGTLILRVGWNYKDEQYEEEVPDVQFVIDPTMLEIHQQLAQMQEESPSQFQTDVPDELKQAHEMSMEQGQPIRPTVIGTKMVTKTRVLANHPIVEVCNYNNVYIDPTAKGDIDKAGFVIYSFESSLSDLKKEGQTYKNLDRINIETNSILGQPDHMATDHVANFRFADEPRQKFVVYEYWGFWDIDGTGMTKPFVAAWVGDTLIRLEESPFPDKKVPFVTCQYLPVRDTAYGEPDGALIIENQKIAGAVTRGMIDLMAKSANGQTGVAKNFLDLTNRRKYEEGRDYEFNPSVDPATNVYMHKYPEIPQSAQFMLQLQNMEAESLIGVKSFSQGISGQSLGDVAAGVRGALDAASKRELAILRRLSNAVVKVGRKFISMNAEFLSPEEVVRVTNDEFVTIRKDDLPGNFDLKLSISTAEEDDNKAEQLAFMLQTVGPNEDPQVRRMILGDIARLRKMPDLAHKLENYQPEPDPMQQRIQELQIQLLEAQLENERAHAIERQAGAQLDAAKVITEQAKAENLASDTDMKNLDFVEQESGVKQERELQKHGEQARSQAQLKMLDREERDKDRKFDLVKEFIKSKSKKAT